MLTFIILGIIQGAVIGLLALGIVLTYKGAKVFNFAAAEFGTIAAFFLLWFREDLGLPYMVAWVLALIGTGGVGFVFERLVVRPLFNAPRVTLLVATAGFALLAIALELKLFGTEIHQIEPIAEGTVIQLFGINITFQQFTSIAIFGGLAAALNYFFNKTDLGLAVLATSQEPVATELVGIGTKKMSAFIWTFAAILGGIGGLLQAPDTTFTAGFMTVNFLLLGFTAAVIGGITSLNGAFVGGLLIGVVKQLASYFDSQYLENLGIPGIPDLAIFVLLLVVLYVRPKGLLGTEA
ncbi:MAG: branched-chain amino acid ABC transporter permease [Actinomycetota bacterium]